MGIFSSIKEKLWGKKAAPAETASSADAPPPVTADATKPVSADMTAATTTASMNAGPAGAKGTGKPVEKTPAAPVDVAAILDAAVKSSGQKLDWKHSIVDLMKALDLDSSLSARKELAAELHYTGDTSDSAKMNVWLHKALMKALAENGGKVPAELLD